MTLTLLFSFFLPAALSFFLTGVVRRYAVRTALLDTPNDRSSHTVATPRGGGVALVITLLGATASLYLVGLLEPDIAIALTAIIPIALVGWIDDRRGVRPLARSAVHASAAVWALYWIGGMPMVRAGSHQFELGLFGSFLALVGVVWATNLYNFMDGIDGIAGAEAMTLGMAGAGLLAIAGATGLAYLSLATAGAAIGFLIWNWAPARIFMGDVGSGVLGFWFAVLAIASERTGAVPAMIWGLVAGVFVLDATLTLLRRAARRQPVHMAHRSHAYQRMVGAGWSHRRVVVGIVVMNLGLAALGWASQRSPALAVPAFTLGFAALGVIYLIIERRAPMS